MVIKATPFAPYTAGPITRRCAWCQRVHRDGRWLLEEARADLLYSHAVCEDCLPHAFPDPGSKPSG